MPEQKYKIPFGAQPSTCKSASCKARIFWIVTPLGKSMPVDPDGTPHWSSCPDAEKFHKSETSALEETPQLGLF